MKAKKDNKIKADDKKSIEQLCNDTWEPVYHFVYYKVQNQEEAEDITQEAYVKAISYIRNKEIIIENIISFLKTVSLNIIRDRWRKSKRQGVSINIDDLNPKETEIKDPTDELGQQQAIKDALKLLNEEQRTVIDLRILKGYSVADTAEKMSKTEGNIRTLQFRALKNLSKYLEKDFSKGGNYNG